jgi:hypothetical protein
MAPCVAECFRAVCLALVCAGWALVAEDAAAVDVPEDEVPAGCCAWTANASADAARATPRLQRVSRIIEASERK